jgi:hypoxanthine phosphoribosyltransferase
VITGTLFDEDLIARRVRELGARISRDYAGRCPLVIGVLTAAAVFLADLVRAIEIPCEIDLVAVTRFDPRQGIRIEKDTAVSVEGRHVILVDDSIATGATVGYLMQALHARGPASLALCTLLDRPHRRPAGIDVTYAAFEAPDLFIVGYGLDHEGRYRALPALHSYAPPEQ